MFLTYPFNKQEDLCGSVSRSVYFFLLH